MEKNVYSRVIFEQVKKRAHLNQILELQRKNLPEALTATESTNEGFLTLKHNLDILSRLNRPHAHIIALNDERVVGYCLIMTKEHRNIFPLVEEMVTMAERVVYRDVPIRETKFMIMGQVCVETSFRGKGVFSGLYKKLKEICSPFFEVCITEVSDQNQRSLRAHLKVGFEEILSYRDSKGARWKLIVWDWR